jgi:hypothetical protein
MMLFLGGKGTEEQVREESSMKTEVHITQPIKKMAIRKTKEAKNEGILFHVNGEGGRGEGYLCMHVCSIN